MITIIVMILLLLLLLLLLIIIIIIIIIIITITLKRFLFTHVVKSPARPIFSVTDFDLQSSHGSNIFGNYPKVVNTERGRFIHTLFYSYF